MPRAKVDAKKAVGGDDGSGGADGDEEAEVEPEHLDAGEARRCRALAARLNCVASERPALQYSVKDVARHMAKPPVGSWQLLKRLECSCCTDLAWCPSIVSIFTTMCISVLRFRLGRLRKNEAFNIWGVGVIGGGGM